MTSDLSLMAERARRHERTLLILLKYVADVPIQDICQEFDCTKSTVLRIARTAGAAKRKRGLPEAVQLAVLQDLNDGLPYKEIASRNRVSEGYVSGVAKKANVSRYAIVSDEELKSDE